MSAPVHADAIMLVPVDDIRLHPQNPRQGDVGAVVESIKANGFYGALVVQRDTNYILVGNHRWMAAKQLGMTLVPVLWTDCTEEQALRIMLADNRTSDLATYDMQQLAIVLKAVAMDTNGLAGSGYDGDDLDQLLNEIAAEPKPEPTGSEACPTCGRPMGKMPQRP